MTQALDIEDLKCICQRYEGSKKVAYLIYPALVPLSDKWIHEMAEKYGVNVAVIYIPADGWNDMLTPWPEPGETHDSPPFAGHAKETLELLQSKVLPQVEKALNLSADVERDLVGVSLSGLFTLWQWMQCSLFKSIASLSGSFWYNGFIEWFEKTPIPKKDGMAYFLLGVKEPKAWIRAYRTVGVNTEKIVERFKEAGIPTIFQWVPGDHFADPVTRAEDAFKALYS